MSERRGFQIERDCGIIGFALFEVFKYNVHHTVNGMGIKSLGVGQGTDTVICTVEYAVSVDKEESFHKFTLISFLWERILS